MLYPKIERLTDIKKPYKRDITDALYDLINLSYVSPSYDSIHVLYDVILYQLYIMIEYMHYLSIKGVSVNKKQVVVYIITPEFINIFNKLFKDIGYNIEWISYSNTSYSRHDNRNESVVYNVDTAAILKHLQQDTIIICLNPIVSNIIYSIIGIDKVVNNNYLLNLELRTIQSINIDNPNSNSNSSSNPNSNLNSTIQLRCDHIIYPPYDNRNSTNLCVCCESNSSIVEYNLYRMINKLIYFNSIYRWNQFKYEDSDDAISSVKYYEPTYDRVTEYYILHTVYKKDVKSVIKAINTIHSITEKISKCTYIQKRFIAYKTYIEDISVVNIRMINNIKFILYQERKVNMYLDNIDKYKNRESVHISDIDMSFTDMYNLDSMLTSKWLPDGYNNDIRRMLNEMIRNVLSTIYPIKPFTGGSN